MKTIICNDFSLHMLNENCTIDIEKISFEKFNEIIDSNNYHSCIGDKDIANLLGLEFNKSNICLDKNTRLIVAKLINGGFSSNKSVISDFEFYNIKYY